MTAELDATAIDDFVKKSIKPNLTVVPTPPAPAPVVQQAAPAQPPPAAPAPAVQAAPPAPQPAPAPVLQAAPAPVPRPAPPAPTLIPVPAPPPMAAAPAPVQMAPAPAIGSKTVIPKIEFAERDVDARRIQEAELARLRQKLQTGPQPLTEEQKQASVLRTQGDINALERILKQPQTTFAAAPAVVPDVMDATAIDKFAKDAVAAAPKPVVKRTPFAGTRGDTGIGGGDGPIAQAALKYLKNLGAATASLADVTIGGIIPGVAGPVTYAAGRMFGQTPEEAAAAEKSVVETLDKPFGKTFGVSETGAYKGELSREIMDFIGANIGKGAKYISEKTGIPESDVANMMGTSLVGVAPLAGKAVKPVAGPAGEVLYAATEPLVRDKTVLAQPRRVEPRMAPEPLDVNLRPVEVTMPTAMSPKMLAETQAAFAKRQEAAAAAKAAMPPPAATTAFDILGGDRTPAGPAVTLPAGAAPGSGATPGSVGAAGVPTITTIQQALLGATPELKAVLSGIPFEQTNVPTFMRHIEADSLPVLVRLTEGQATGDIVKLSNEQNRRGKDPELAQRFNEQNNLLIENINEIRGRAAPDAYGTKIIENSQGIIDAYKAIDGARSEKISAAYKALEDANGGQFPIDGITLAKNAETMLGKKLKTEFLSPSIKSQLERFKSGEPMTFENFEAMRTNLAAEIRKAERSGDGNAAMASSIVREALEQLPLTGQAAGKLKPLADTARGLAKERFDMLKKDPAYKAAVDDAVAADKYLQKFVVNGVNKNIATMVNHLGKDSVAHQHMAAGTVNWLKDKAGIVDETGNFTQAGFNKALKQLDDVKNMEQIFTPDAASQLKTLGNVARYTQAQPRGAFVNNSNTLVGALAEKAKKGISAGVEGGLNVVVPGLQLGTTVMEMRARRANEAQVRQALELGAGAKNK